MGTCTSTIKRHRRSHKRISSKNSIILDNKQPPPLPITILPHQRPHSLSTNLDIQSSSSIEPIFHKTNTNSLIQLYSHNTNNNNSNIINSMASSSSSTSHVPPRIPVPKSRLPAPQIQSSSTGSIRPKTTTNIVRPTNKTGSIRPMSTVNRPPLPSSTQNTTPSRLGSIPRPTAPIIQQAQASSLSVRSRSISPSSTASANSSTSTISQRLAKTQSIPKPISNRTGGIPSTSITNASKSKIPPSTPTSTTKSTVTNRIPSNILSSRPSNTSSSVSIPPIPSTKTDVNAIRDRYKTQKRVNLFSRRTPLTNSLKSPSMETPVIKEEKSDHSSTEEPPTTNISNDNQNNDLKTEASENINSTATTSNRPPSVQGSQVNRPRQRTASTLSSSSQLSDALNQDLLLDDENCSLKSDDLICDFEDTLTFDSVSKTDQTDSCSSTSLTSETRKKPTMIKSIPTTKPNIAPFQPVLKEQRSSPITKTSTNGNLRESLDELTQLSHRMDNIIDNEQNRRLLTRSVSLKPPPTSLPPREDGEQITMDIESYRQVMKDVMVVKTILHQLDRLLKHSDGANMTDSMIGSFHESMIGPRRYSSAVDNNSRPSIDENSSYDDLVKEIVILRKEKEQDKQTIKLLQEQMYKYSSQTNGS